MLMTAMLCIIATLAALAVGLCVGFRIGQLDGRFWRQDARLLGADDPILAFCPPCGGHHPERQQKGARGCAS